MPQIDVQLFAGISENHAGSAFFDVQGSPVRHLWKVLTDVLTIHGLSAEQEQMNRFLFGMDSQHLAQIALQLHHFVQQASTGVEREIGVAAKRPYRPLVRPVFGRS